MKTEKRIALACFIGAVIGTLLALQFNHYFWWVGIIVGGLVGYVGYNFREIPATAKMVWNQMPEKKNLQLWITQSVGVLKMLGIGVLMLLGVAVLVFVGVMLTTFTLLSVIGSIGNTCNIYASYFRGGEVSFTTGISPTDPAGTVGIATMSVILVIAGSLLLAFYWSGRNTSKDSPDMLAFAIICFCAVPFILPVLLPIVLFCLAGISIYWTAKTGIKIGWKTFKLVHSDIRLLCMTDAMFGALAGFYFGNALVGGIVGALCGVLNYRLVSVKLLKLVKA
jgi:hypothetical protein